MMAHNRVAHIAFRFLAHNGWRTTPDIVLFSLIIFASLLFLLRGVLDVLYQYWNAAISLRIRLNTRSLLFEKALQTQFEHLTRQSRGALLNDIIQPSDAINVSVKGLSNVLN